MYRKTSCNIFIKVGSYIIVIWSFVSYIIIYRLDRIDDGESI